MTLADIAFFEGLVFPLIALGVLAAWVYALVDLFRNPSLSGGAKAMWLVIIILLPFLGTVIYLAVRDDW
jgi:Phospholipase_D-nuclease N-terminal